MNKENIVSIIEQKHQELFDWLANSSEENWEKGPDERWTTGQQILHLVNTGKMLNKALKYPKFILKYKFGTSNRPSRSYEDVAKRYQERLTENKERAKEFNKGLRKPLTKEKQELTDSLQVLSKKLQYKTSKFKDKHLDTLLLPHPLMGRMTLREIIMWSAYHTEHHLQILKNDYSS
ncbi:DinB family protein [Pseudotenacibaculum sp. MALMAid0570]|uniref:DinB family protein n=1 Tax=Pseudotenacibaculum sp. MALMAid0570 TaxID=3143938 RepID=UPI0032E0314F